MSIAAGTPWATTALRNVTFHTVHHGDGVLIHGGNGSGKSTLGLDHGRLDGTDDWHVPAETAGR